MPEGRNHRDVLDRLNVSRETENKLCIFVDLLLRWRRITDLVSDATLDDIWTRHIEDCAQLLPLSPLANRWLDLGAGAGFPGLVIAILLENREGSEVHLVESDQRKCSFLRTAISATGARAIVHPVRIETLKAETMPPVDTITARALAPFPKLVDLCRPWLVRGTTGIFPRGRRGAAELLAYLPQAEFAIECIVSRTDPCGIIFRVESPA